MSIHRIFKQICAFGVLAFAVAAPSFSQERGVATVEEGERIVKLASEADKDPLKVMSSADGRWFMKWTDEVPDYMFGPDSGAFWFESGAAKGDMKRVVRFHHTLSTAAFQLKNKIKDPQKNKANFEAKTLAGVEGLLRAYQSLLAKNPDVRSPALDEAIVVRDKGGLAEFVKKLPAMPGR